MVETIIRPAWRTRTVAEIAWGDVDRLHRKVSAHAPIRANRTISLLSKLFALAIRWQMRGDNPAKGIERNHEDRRKRYLSGDELARLLAALDGLQHQADGGRDPPPAADRRPLRRGDEHALAGCRSWPRHLGQARRARSAKQKQDHQVRSRRRGATAARGAA